MNLIGKSIVCQNASLTFPGDVWMSCGLPENAQDGAVQARDDQDNIYPVVVDGLELLARVPLEAGEKKTLVLEATGAVANEEASRSKSRGADRPYRMASWVSDNLGKIVPKVTCVWEGQEYEAPMVVRGHEWNGARLRYNVRFTFAEFPVTVEGWIDIFDDQELVEWVFLSTFGNIEGDHQLASTHEPGTWHNDTAGRLEVLRVGFQEKSFIDHRINKGIPDSYEHNGYWQVELCRPSTFWVNTDQWHHAESTRVRGAIACLPETPTGATYSDPRALNMRHREEAACRMMLHSSHWEGFFGPTGHIPRIPRASIRSQRLTEFYNYVYSRLTTPGSMSLYPFGACPGYANFPESGATGAQPDFGVSSGTFCIAYDEPGALHWYERDVDCWARRAYIYRDRNGDQFAAKNIPSLRTFGLTVIAAGWSPNGTLGWQKPEATGLYYVGDPANGVPHGERYQQAGDPSTGGPNSHWSRYHWWSANDEQHRSENLLGAMYQLTRDPSLKPTIDGILELDSRILWRTVLPDTGPTGTNLGNPRGWGRPMVGMSWFARLGFTRAKEQLELMTQKFMRDFTGAAGGQYENATMAVTSWDQWTFGYLHPNGQAIRGPISWQESIMLMGLWCAWKIGITPKGFTRDEFKTAITRVAQTLRDHLIFKFGGSYYVSKVYQWNGGEPWPESHLFPGSEDPNDPNYNPWVAYWNGYLGWCIPGVKIAEELDPSTRGQEILEYWGEATGLSEAQWEAVTEIPE